MSYTPTNWKSGDTVTSAKLNKLEQGVASSSSGGILMVYINETTLDKTWKEIHEAMQEKIVCICPPVLAGTIHMFISGAMINDSNYMIIAFTVGPDGSINANLFVTDSEDGYPTLVEDNSDPGGFVIDNPNLG